jgi:hypothetical protein
LDHGVLVLLISFISSHRVNSIFPIPLVTALNWRSDD